MIDSSGIRPGGHNAETCEWQPGSGGRGLGGDWQRLSEAGSRCYMVHTANCYENGVGRARKAGRESWISLTLSNRFPFCPGWEGGVCREGSMLKSNSSVQRPGVFQEINTDQYDQSESRWLDIVWGSRKEVESSCEDLWAMYGITFIPKALGSRWRTFNRKKGDLIKLWLAEL